MEDRTGTQRQTSNGKNNPQVIRPIKQITCAPTFSTQHQAICLQSLIICISVSSLTAKDYFIRTWEKHHLNPHFWAEGGRTADFNRDGLGDVVVGPTGMLDQISRNVTLFTQTKIHLVKAGKRETARLSRRTESTQWLLNNLTYTYDFNGDEWPDVLVFGWPGKNTTWYENPQGKYSIGQAPIFKPPMENHLDNRYEQRWKTKNSSTAEPSTTSKVTGTPHLNHGNSSVSRQGL